MTDRSLQSRIYNSQQHAYPKINIPPPQYPNTINNPYSTIPYQNPTYVPNTINPGLNPYQNYQQPYIPINQHVYPRQIPQTIIQQSETKTPTYPIQLQPNLQQNSYASTTNPGYKNNKYGVPHVRNDNKYTINIEQKENKVGKQVYENLNNIRMKKMLPRSFNDSLFRNGYDSTESAKKEQQKIENFLKEYTQYNDTVTMNECIILPPLLIRYKGDKDINASIIVKQNGLLADAVERPDFILNFMKSTGSITITVCKLNNKNYRYVERALKILYSLYPKKDIEQKFTKKEILRAYDHFSLNSLQRV